MSDAINPSHGGARGYGTGAGGGQGQEPQYTAPVQPDAHDPAPHGGAHAAAAHGGDGHGGPLTPAQRWPTTWGLMAEYDREDRLVDAARQMYKLGYRRMDAYSPFPVHGLADALGRKRSKLPLLVLAGGLAGLFGGFTMQVFSAVWHYPVNIGGRPYYSWPAFLPITFETTVLCAALTAVFGMLALNGLPQPYHPVFNVRGFERASRNGFFLVVETRDPRFDIDASRRDLEQTDPRAISEVPV